MNKRKHELFEQLEAELKKRGYESRKGDDGAITTGRPFKPHRGRLHAVAVIFVDVVEDDKLLYYGLPLTTDDGHLVLLRRNCTAAEANRLKTELPMAGILADRGTLTWVEIGRNDAALAVTLMGQAPIDKLDDILDDTAGVMLDVWDTLDESEETKQ